jgi:hypothetical protein
MDAHASHEGHGETRFENPIDQLPGRSNRLDYSDPHS